MAERSYMEQQIQLRSSDHALEVKYSNHVQIMQAKEEFILDFMSVFPPQGSLISRIALSPGHIKRLYKVLGEQIKAYESQFGNITESKEPEKKIGF